MKADDDDDDDELFFVVWLTDKRRLALFPARTIVRDKLNKLNNLFAKAFQFP